jgi:hypothetical protein
MAWWLFVTGRAGRSSGFHELVTPVCDDFDKGKGMTFMGEHRARQTAPISPPETVECRFRLAQIRTVPSGI